MAGHLYRVNTQRSPNNQIWFRFIMQEDGVPELKIYSKGIVFDTLEKTISGLGDRPEGTYASRSRAVFWNKRDTGGGLLGNGKYYVELYIDTFLQDTIRFALW